MAMNTERLNQFFEQVKTLTFWQRLFRWSQFRSLSYEAYEEFKMLLSDAAKSIQEIGTAKTEVSVLKNENEHLRKSQSALEYEVSNLREKVSENLGKISELTSSVATKDEAVRQAESNIKGLEIEVATAKERIGNVGQENSQLKQENTIFKQTEDDRKANYEKAMATLNAIKEKIQADRDKEITYRQQEEIERLNKMKDTWMNHQEDVKNQIKIICERNTIEYVDMVPFKGSPDNAIKVCDEFIIFDAKSPASDDLANFPTYIKLQTESVKKYIKEGNVRKDIFLVIPSNTVDVIDRFSHNMADYTVYVVTLDALEPIILSLKKLEEYEFVEQLSPEDRDNICRVIGKFAHVTKRRIQIDQFFERQFLEVLSKCEADLPRDIQEKVIEYERSEKLNPPQEKRAKIISSTELETDSNRIRKEAEAKAISFPASVQQGIKSLPLYSDESSNEEKE
jgi:hypothetical protein